MLHRSIAIGEGGIAVNRMREKTWPHSHEFPRRARDPDRMPSRNSRKRAEKRVDHSGRLRRLKAVAVGTSAVLGMSLWWLVTGAVASSQTTASASSASTFTNQSFEDQGSFFGAASGPTLGSGSTFQRPMLRSGGS